MNAQEPPKKRQEQLHWLVDPDAVTIRTEGPRLILRCGPYDSQERAFRCRFEDESPKRLGKLVRLLDLHLALEEKLRQLEDEDEDDAGN